jgi:hypothetical protein
MRVVECARLARLDYNGLPAGTVLFKNPGRHDEGSSGLTVVVEAGGLPGHPTDRPNVIVRTVMQPLIPAVVGAQPHSIQPFRGGGISFDSEISRIAGHRERRYQVPPRPESGRRASALTTTGRYKGDPPILWAQEPDQTLFQHYYFVV